MQPNIFMWGGLLKSLIESDLHVIRDDVKSTKNARYNRNLIAGTGEILWFTIPFVGFKDKKLINQQNLTDAHTCYKVFKKSLYKKISLKENGFSFCPELTTKLSNINEKIIEVPISYNGRDYKAGKKIKFSDGIEAVLTIFKYKFLN